MGMLDRYKKTKGGFGQLLQLIETSPQKKREQFLALIAEENTIWEEHLRKRLLSVEKIFSWDQQVLSEILSRLQPLTLAVALFGNPSEDTEKLLACLPPITKRKITDMIADSSPSTAEKATCMMKIISEVRGYISQGIVKLEKIDPELYIPENFEDMLASMSAGFSADVIVIKCGNSPDFDQNKKPDAFGKPIASTEVVASTPDLDLLKRKMNQLIAEVNSLKNENSQLKDKLAQIKKIA